MGRAFLTGADRRLSVWLILLTLFAVFGAACTDQVAEGDAEGQSSSESVGDAVDDSSAGQEPDASDTSQAGGGSSGDNYGIRSNGDDKPLFLLTPATEDLRYLIEGSAGSIDITWTGRLGGTLAETIDTTEGRHEIAIGDTVRGVNPTISVAGEEDLGSLAISILSGDELIQKCDAIQHQRDSISCTATTIAYEGLQGSLTVTVDQAATVTIYLATGAHSSTQTVQVNEATSIELPNQVITYAYVTATSTSEDASTAMVTLSVDGEVAASGPNFASLYLNALIPE